MDNFLVAAISAAVGAASGMIAGSVIANKRIDEMEAGIICTLEENGRILDKLIEETSEMNKRADADIAKMKKISDDVAKLVGVKGKGGK